MDTIRNFLKNLDDNKSSLSQADRITGAWRTIRPYGPMSQADRMTDATTHYFTAADAEKYRLKLR